MKLEQFEVWFCVGYDNAYYNIISLDQWFSNCGPWKMTSESPKHVLEMYILGPHLRHTESGDGACSSVF